MTDTAFSDSYITTDAILETMIGSDPRTAAVALKAAAAATQAWYCQKATKNIDALPLRGRKYERDGSQALQFPREYMTPYGWYPDCNEEGTVEVPQAVIDACLEEAIAIYAATAAGNSSRQALQEAGVRSFSIGGKLSETFAPGAANRFFGLKSPDAYRLISKYIARSVPII